MISLSFGVIITAGALAHWWKGWGGADFTVPFLSAGPSYSYQASEFDFTTSIQLAGGLDDTSGDTTLSLDYGTIGQIESAWTRYDIQPVLIGTWSSYRWDIDGRADTDESFGYGVGVRYGSWQLSATQDYRKDKYENGDEWTSRIGISWRW